MLHEPEPRTPGRRPPDYPEPEGGWPSGTPRVAEHDWLMVEWDSERNAEEGADPERRRLGSKVLVWWKCRVCAQEWEAAPRDRFLRASSNCPNGCISSWTLPISETHPDAAATLRDADPDLVFYDTPGQMIWFCGTDGHEDVVTTVVGWVTQGCPDCRAPAPLLLDTAYAGRLAYPASVGPSTRITSKESVTWRCDEGHTFRRRIVRYTQETDECPICNGRSSGETLSDTHPELVIEWADTNLVSPDSLRPTSWVFVDWVCSACGCRWTANVANRTRGGSGCPECWKRRGSSSLVEQEIARLLSAVLDERLQTQVRVDNGVGAYSIDIMTDDLIAVEYDSWYWHQERYQADLTRSQFLEAAGYRMIHVRESGLEPVNSSDVSYDPGRDTLEQIAARLTDEIARIRAARSGTEHDAA